MNKLKTYKTFETHIIRDENVDINYEDKIDKIIQALLEQKVLVQMLGDTINHVSQAIEKVLPQPLEDFMADLLHYDEEIFTCIDDIQEKIINGMPNIKDMIEDVEHDFNMIENYLKMKDE